MPAHLVLLVDSHEDSRAIYRVILEHHGFRVLATACLDEGARLAREQRPDLVFLEVTPTGTRVLEVARALRADAATGRIPLVALSTIVAPGDREAVLASGFSAYLLKPVAPLDLLAEAKRILGR